MRKKAQFGQVISGYVDPTPEGLNVAYQRHMDNLMMSESIRQEGAKLKAAPFEGDQQMRRELLDTSDKALQNIVSKASYGNLSNFTSAVNRASTEFMKRSQPIAQNQQLYTAYTTKVDKLLEKGKIDAEDAQGSLLLSTMGYNGLSYDESGEVTGYFNGKEVYQNPGIQDMINKALSNVEPDSWKEVRKILGAGPDGSLTVETEQGEKYISADKVAAALSGVTNDPAVIGYYTRKGEIRTAMMKDEEVQERITNMIGVQGDRADEARSALANAKTPEEKAALQSRLDSANEAAGDLQKMIQKGDMEGMRNKLIATQRDQLINTPIMAAISAKTSMNTVDSVKQGYDAKWMAEYKQRLRDASAAAAGNTAIEIQEEGIVYNRIGGDNAGVLALRMEETDNKLNSLYEDFQNIDSLSEQGQQDLRQQIFDVEREARMQHNLFMDLYKTTPEELLDTDEYRVLQSKIAALEGPMPAVTATSASQFRMEEASAMNRVLKLNAAKRELRDFITNLGLESPVGGKTTVSIDYVDPITLGGSAKISGEVKNHFSAGFNPRMVVIDPDTGTDITLEELAAKQGWGDLGELEYANFGVSQGAPLETGPTMRIGFTDAKGRGQSFIAPVGPGVNINIPSLQEYYYGNGGSIVNELLTYQNEGMNRIDDIPWYSPSGRTGYISADLTSSEGGTISIMDADKNLIRKLGLQDPKLQEYLNGGEVILR